MDYNKIREALDYGEDRIKAEHPYWQLKPDEQDEFHKMKDKRIIRANRKKALSLLRDISPEIRQQMAARVAATMDAFGARAIDYNESPSHLAWGFRYLPKIYRANNLLNYPSYCQTFPLLAKEFEERNAQLPKEISDLIERTWGMYFGGAPFDHRMVAMGRDPDKKMGYYHDGMLRVLKDPNYSPHYEEGKVISLSKGKVSDKGFQYYSRDMHFSGYRRYLPIHPQTIQNVVGKDAVVDILEIQSYDHGWPVARGRIERVLKSMGIKAGKMMKIHFPGHGGDDAWFGGGPDYTPSLYDQSGNNVDILEGGKNPPLIIVQNDYGKGKFHDQAMWAAQDMGFMKGRTVFKYVLAHDEVGSDGWDGGGNVGDVELNMLTFEQICIADMRRIAVSMLGDGDKDSEKIVRILASDYLEEEYREKLRLSSGAILNGESSREITPDMFLEER